jgi:hypothetical protein
MQEHFGYDYGFRWHALLIVCAYIVAVRLASIWALKNINFLKR